MSVITAITKQIVCQNLAAYTYTQGTPYIFASIESTLQSGSTYACSYNTTTGDFTVNVTGTYTILFHSTVAGGTTTAEGQNIVLNLNGSPVTEGSAYSFDVGNSSSSYTSSPLYRKLSLVAGDVFFFVINTYGAPTLTIKNVNFDTYCVVTL